MGQGPPTAVRRVTRERRATGIRGEERQPAVLAQAGTFGLEHLKRLTYLLGGELFPGEGPGQAAPADEAEVRQLPTNRSTRKRSPVA